MHDLEPVQTQVIFYPCILGTAGGTFEGQGTSKDLGNYSEMWEPGFSTVLLNINYNNDCAIIIYI